MHVSYEDILKFTSVFFVCLIFELLGSSKDYKLHFLKPLNIYKALQRIHLTSNLKQSQLFTCFHSLV